MEINRHLYDLQQNKTITNKINDNRTWEKTDFNFEQEQVRKSTNTQYENIITLKMTNVVRKVQNDVYEKCNLKEM
jgi:hypothetical protein